jgi:DNA-damage-inducible protein J
MATNQTARRGMVHIRIDNQVKEMATNVFGVVGLFPLEAARLFRRRVVLEDGYPCELKLANEATLGAIDEANEILAQSRTRLLSPDKVFNELEKGREEYGRL